MGGADGVEGGGEVLGARLAEGAQQLGVDLAQAELLALAASQRTSATSAEPGRGRPTAPTVPAALAITTGASLGPQHSITRVRGKRSPRRTQTSRGMPLPTQARRRWPASLAPGGASTSARHMLPA